MATRGEKEDMLEFLSQRGNFEKFISSNKFDLCMRTVNILGLSAYLQFDSDTHAELMNLPSGFQKAELFYDNVLKMGTGYLELLKALEETGNEHLVRDFLKKFKTLKKVEKPGFSEVCMVYAGTNYETTPRLGILQLLAMVYLPAPPPPPIFEPSLPADKINETHPPPPQQQLLASAPDPAPTPNHKTDFKLIDKLGFGAFGTVYLARTKTHDDKNASANANEQSLFAIKVIGLRSSDLDEATGREVEILEALKERNDPRSRFIVRIQKHWREPGATIPTDLKDLEKFLKENPIYQDFAPDKRHEIEGLFFIQMELCVHGNLESWVSRNNIQGQPSPEKVEQCRRWFGQVVEGVTLLHSLGIWHRDLKLCNIVLADEEDPVEIGKGHTKTAKIADFGISRYRPTAGQPLTANVGTDYYMSPEVRDGSNYSEKADIFSLGVILVNLLRPMTEMRGERKFTVKGYYKFMDGHIVPAEFFTDFPAEARMAERMLREDPEERPTSEELLKWCKSQQFI